MIHLPLEKAIKTTPAHLKKCHKMGLFRVQDLLEFFPRALESTTIKSEVGAIVLKEKNTLEGTLSHINKQRTKQGKYLTKADFILDDGSTIKVVWFQSPYQLKRLTTPVRCFLVGKVDRNYGVLQIANPEIHLEAKMHVGSLRPVYPESPPITSKWLREKIHPLLNLVSDFPEVLPPDIRKDHDLMTKRDAIKAIHFPETGDAWKAAQARLGFEEIFGIQLRVMHAKLLRQAEHQNVYRVPFNAEQIKSDLAQLPFDLTGDQKVSLFEILQDLEKDRPSHRLLQGDVGAGKTIVAFLSVLQMIRAGHQAAILVPTEILAQQHFAGAGRFLAPFTDVFEAHSDLFGDTDGTDQIVLLTGSTPAKQKTQIKEGLKHGQIKLVIGTHAILTEDTIFKSLGMAVIDEQHRFGVAQRAILAGSHTHTISMTATPIPRSLALTLYGDQDISIIAEKPAGRKDIITRIVADTKTETLAYRFIEDQIEKGRQVFWVCPLVDESDKMEAKNVKDEYVRISEQLFPSRRVAFLHGKMKPAEKKDIMDQFKAHEFDILVSTSVIEVGVDIPNATVMVIENSERFGLAQLHQFRGRIGRNDLQSYCFLMVGRPDDKHKARLKAMEQSNDGFYLSEIDLKLRGAGEIYGLKQSGIPDLKCADLSDTALIKSAREAATKVLESDLTLSQYPHLQRLIATEKVYF